MNLKSCDNCAVVLDLDKARPLTETDVDGTKFPKEVWQDGDIKNVIECPVCQAEIYVECD